MVKYDFMFNFLILAGFGASVQKLVKFYLTETGNRFDTSHSAHLRNYFYV